MKIPMVTLKDLIAILLLIAVPSAFCWGSFTLIQERLARHEAAEAERAAAMEAYARQLGQIYRLNMDGNIEL